MKCSHEPSKKNPDWCGKCHAMLVTLRREQHARDADRCPKCRRHCRQVKGQDVFFCNWCGETFTDEANDEVYGVDPVRSAIKNERRT